MGCYLNPTDETKEEFLSREAVGCKIPVMPEDEGTVLVCLIENLHFTAAGVMHSEGEFERWSESDGRPRTWYLLEKANLKNVVLKGDLQAYFPDNEW